MTDEEKKDTQDKIAACMIVEQHQLAECAEALAWRTAHRACALLSDERKAEKLILEVIAGTNKKTAKMRRLANIIHFWLATPPVVRDNLARQHSRQEKSK